MKRDDRHQPAPVVQRETEAQVLASIVEALRRGARRGAAGVDEVECGELMRRLRAAREG